MNITRKKNVFTRLYALFCAVFMTVIVFAFSTISVNASAAEITNQISISDSDEQISNTANTPVFVANSLEAAPLGETSKEFEIVALAAGGAGGASGSTSADSTYQTVINFFITWLRRIGMVVALVGAIMFGLAIKNNDAEQKQAGLLTLIAGFVVAAICQAADMFDLFS